MVQKITYGQLIAIDKDLDNIRQNSQGIFFLMSTAIKNFHDKNKTRLQLAKAGIKKIMVSHTALGEDGQPLVTVGEDGIKEYQWLTPDNKVSCEKELQKFLDIQIDVYL